MTGRTTTEAAHALLVQADPLPLPPTFDDHTVAAVVHRARAAEPLPLLRSPRPAMSPRRRSAIAAGVLVVTTAAVWAAVAALPAEDGSSRPGPAQGGSLPAPQRQVATSSSPTTTPSVGTPTSSAPAVSTDPVVVLRDAATALTGSPAAPTPRSDQFLYVTESSGYQAWLSMDGTHDGLIEPADGSGAAVPVPGCRDGKAVQQVGTPGGTPTVEYTPCTPDPAYRPDLPADPDALRTYLASQDGGSTTNDVAKAVLATLEFTYLTPATRAALFTVVSGYDGLTVVDVPAQPDAVGVTWSYGGGRVTLVFGRTDHALRKVLDGDGSSLDGFRSVVVDAVGQKG